MRLSFERYKAASSRLTWSSVLQISFGVIALAGGSFSGWIGLLMIFMTNGGIWERRAGVFLSIFTGFFPLVLGSFLVYRGVRSRRKLRAFTELAALARRTPMFHAEDVTRALDVGPAEAQRIVLDAMTQGLLEDGPPPPGTGLTPPAHTHPPHAQLGVASSEALAHTVADNPGSLVGVVLHDTYRIEAPIGAGGMGVVLRARHLRTGRSYAVKMLAPEARFSPDARARFEREAIAASALGHPNIIAVHDFNETPDGLYYLVMDLLEGETLEQRLTRTGFLPWREAKRITGEVGAGLAAAHERGLLHRDVKPGNVFLARTGNDADERAILLDFGLVMPIEHAAQSRITRTGAAVGTPLYMSPEQARGEAVDARSDVYALAATLFEIVTGAPPFLDATLANVYAKLLTTEAPRASSLATAPIPAALDAVLARALMKSRDERYPDVRAFLAAVASVDAPRSVGAA